MTIIADTRVVRLARTAARMGHQHSGDQPIIETVTNELVTASFVSSLPPGSLISLQRGPAVGLTEEGSVLNSILTEIGGVQGSQTSSVTFNSEDSGITAGLIFQTEIDFALTLSAAGQYAINYKTFQIKTYTPVPVTPGNRILVSYSWTPIREYLEWNQEDLEPDLIAFGSGPHAGGSGGDSVSSGHGINITDIDGYKEISVDVPSLAGYGLSYETIDGKDRLKVTILDGYTSTIHFRKFGLDSENPPLNTIFKLDGYEYPLGQDRVLVFINGISQFSPMDFTERSTSTIEIAEPCDDDDVVDILLLPHAFGSAITNGGTTDLQGAYNNSAINDKTILLDEGQVTFNQTQSSGSALRLISGSSITPVLSIEQGGGSEAARFKSLDNTSATLTLQKDVSNRNSVLNTLVIERSTSHILGGQSGIGSCILTRLENSGTNLFTASKIITGTTDAADATENSYLAVELMDDGILGEKFRILSNGYVGILTNSPGYTLDVRGDGYYSMDLEVAGQIKVHNTPNAPFNIPILTYEPATLKDGDIWISDMSGVKKFNVRIGGTTYSVSLIS